MQVNVPPGGVKLSEQSAVRNWGTLTRAVVLFRACRRIIVSCKFILRLQRVIFR